jgi:O-antigen/teichoic acid export membrane protein
VFPFLLVGFGAIGIFATTTLAGIMAGLFSAYVLMKFFFYKFRFQFNMPLLKSVFRFSFGNYLVSYLWSLPLLVLPIVIANQLGSEIAAYFYIAAMIMNVLFMVPFATAQSLFAEGSFAENSLSSLIKRAAFIISILLIPGILILILFGEQLLLIFGKQYSVEGLTFLKLMSFSSVFVAINTVAETILRVRKRIGVLILLNSVIAVIVLGVSYILLPLGLTGIAVAWIVGQSAGSLIYFYLLSFSGRY